jgi:RimJ/RimL family protein N-acetyltransferase
MPNYKCLSQQVFQDGAFSLVPIRDEDKYDIMQWRNEQIYHLRQAKPLSKEDQESYFENVVAKLFDEEKPKQILFSYLENGVCVGYGGLVHINGIDKNAEISFLTKTERSQDIELFGKDWSCYLKLLKETAFNQLNLKKIYTYAFDLRPQLYPILENCGFIQEARMKNHIYFDNKFYDVLIHACFNPFYHRKANLLDTDIYFNWANDKTTRENSFDTKPIIYENHVKWFSQKIQDKKALLLIFEDENNTPIGQIRIENKDNEHVIGISIDTNFRGKGYAAKMYVKACQEYYTIFGKSIIHAYIKKENIASIKSFEKAGFLLKSRLNYAGFETILMYKVLNEMDDIYSVSHFN